MFQGAPGGKLLYIFPVIGIGLLLGAAYTFVETHSFIAEAVAAEGEVIDLARSRSSDSVTYAPVVRFSTPDGASVEFRSTSASNPPAYAIGERVTVLYREGAPHRARIQGFWSLWAAPAILGGMGAVFTLVGSVFFLPGLGANRRRDRLRSSGIAIDTALQGVERNTSLKVNGRNPYQVVTQWQNPATGEIHVFKSENLWYDPTQHIKQDRIRVLIERGNPKRYWVDLSFLPKLAAS